MPPEVIATDEIFTVHKNLLEVCRRFHSGEPVRRASLEANLDTLHAIVVALQMLTEERYA